MSTAEEHEREQAAITAACEAANPDDWAEMCDRILHEELGEHIPNYRRAARALRAIYPGYHGDDLEATLTDALTDIRHLCDLAGYDFFDLDGRAKDHYQAEIYEGNGPAAHEELQRAIKEDLE